MKNIITFLGLLSLLFFCPSIGIAQSRTAGKPTSRTKANSPIGAMINFKGGEDIRALAHDKKNLYVALAWTKRMVAIDKATGEEKVIKSPNHDIQSVVVANEKCYYYVCTEGIYSYDPANGTSEGPLFGLDVNLDELTEVKMAVSPDGHYLYCHGYVIDLPLQRVVGKTQMGRQIGINNVGGAYYSTPAAFYNPLSKIYYPISERVVVHCFYPDPVSGDTFYCCEQGFGSTPMIPEPEAGIKRYKILEGHFVDCVTRDDEGNFVFGLRDGVAFGGKTLEEPINVVNKLKSGIPLFDGSSMDITVSSATLVSPDGEGNIVFASSYENWIFIYNPKGLKGYSGIKGKASKF